MRRTWCVKALWYGFALCLLYLLQEVILTRVLPLSPLLFPVAVSVVALRVGRTGGAVFGLFAGLCVELVSPQPQGIFVLALCGLGLLLGLVAEAGMQPTLWNGWLCTAAALCLLDGIRSLYYVWMEAAPWGTVVRLSGQEILLSLLCFPFVCILFRKVHTLAD